MKQINTYILEKLVISKAASDALTNETHDRNDEITKDFRELYRILCKELGPNHECCDSLIVMADFTDDYSEFYYEWDPDKWAVFLRDVVNYDLIALYANGIIDVETSNHKDIAKIMKKYNKPEIGKKVWASFR